jgi:hypothetical protein
MVLGRRDRRHDSAGALGTSSREDLRSSVVSEAPICSHPGLERSVEGCDREKADRAHPKHNATDRLNDEHDPPLLPWLGPERDVEFLTRSGDRVGRVVYADHIRLGTSSPLAGDPQWISDERYS